MSNKGSGIACGIIGIFMMFMGLHMMGHDEGIWWFFADLIMAFLGMIDIIIGYVLVTE